MTTKVKKSISQVPPTLLLLGGSGQVGFELKRSLGPLARVVAPDRQTLDLNDTDAVRKFVRALRPKAVVNAAAYTAVDKAESEPEASNLLNHLLPRCLAEEVDRQQSILIHYSTDYVFDGSSLTPYTETHSVDPINEYGRSKAAGEQAVQVATNRFVILRTSWVIGAYGHNFLRTILKLATNRNELRVVGDQIGAPTTAHFIADITAHIWRSFWIQNHPLISGQPTDQSQGDAQFPFGLYHLTSSGYTNWHELACYIVDRARQMGMKQSLEAEKILRISSEEYPTMAKRPANSRLNTQKLQKAFGLQMPAWESEVDHLLAIILA